MSYGIIYNGQKYMRLHNNNNFKQLSLEDNVYFTLRDIFLNGETYEFIMNANEFNGELTNNICYEDRTETFKYTDKLNDVSYVKLLKTWLSVIKPYYFGFDNVWGAEDFESYKEHFIGFEEWWKQFTTMREKINERFIELTNNTD